MQGVKCQSAPKIRPFCKKIRSQEILSIALPKSDHLDQYVCGISD